MFSWQSRYQVDHAGTLCKLLAGGTKCVNGASKMILCNIFLLGTLHPQLKPTNKCPYITSNRIVDKQGTGIVHDSLLFPIPWPTGEHTGF